MTGFLVVRVGQRHLGLEIDRMVAVIDGFDVDVVPSVNPAVRGVTTVHERIVPLIHLGSLITNTRPPDPYGRTMVLADCGGAVTAFEVDDANEVVFETPQSVPDGLEIPWASGVARWEGKLIPIVSVATLVDRLDPVILNGAA
ncbi:MAG: chemotaxis protein CheW [Gemmatimonadales bacterium]